MNTILSKRVDEVDSVFKRTLPMVHSSLISAYRLSEVEATEAERDLEVWFHRLSRRGSGAQVPPKSLRVSLLAAACQYGRSFQIWRLRGSPSRDKSLNDVLSREPQEMASDLAHHFAEDS